VNQGGFLKEIVELPTHLGQYLLLVLPQGLYLGGSQAKATWTDFNVALKHLERLAAKLAF